MYARSLIHLLIHPDPLIRLNPRAPLRKNAPNKKKNGFQVPEKTFKTPTATILTWGVTLRSRGFFLQRATKRKKALSRARKKSNRCIPSGFTRALNQNPTS